MLKFLKKGSGIHIKKKNKGSFTRWCGGNVTEECIERGKNSPNPKIRKKATFADNARHFKHKNGGFVKGVNVLDSNPKAYKEVKKKYKMHQQGGSIDWKELGNIGLQFFNGLKKNQAINKFIEANNTELKANNVQAQQYGRQLAEQEITNENSYPLENQSNIVRNYKINQLAQKYAQQIINQNNLNTQQENLNLEQFKSNSISDMLSSLSNWGINYLTNKTSNSKNNPPSTESTIYKSGTGSLNLSNMF